MRKSKSHRQATDLQPNSSASPELTYRSLVVRIDDELPADAKSSERYPKIDTEALLRKHEFLAGKELQRRLEQKRRFGLCNTCAKLNLKGMLKQRWNRHLGKPQYDHGLGVRWSSFVASKLDAADES
jgi:hypothetical protein